MGSEPTDRLSEIPELEPSRPHGEPLPRRPQAAAPASAATSASASVSVSVSVSGTRDAISEPQSAGAAVPYLGTTIDLGDDFSDDLGPGASAIPIADLAVEREPPPTGKTPDTLTLSCNAAAVAELAGYGEAKASLIGSVLYAVRVMRRRKPIAENLTQARAELDQAEDARDRELVRFVVQLQPILQKGPQFRPLIAQLVRTDETLRQSEYKLSATRETAQGELGGLQARREELRGELAQRSDRERKRAAAAAETERARKREEARLNRIQIEIRSLEKRDSQEEPADASATTEITTLEEQARAIQPEVGTAREMDAQAQSRLRAAREARVQMQREIAQLDAHVENSNENAAAKVGSARDDVREVRKKGRTAYADVARSLLSDPDAWNTGSVDFSAVRAVDKVVSERARSVALAERAGPSHDGEIYEQGRKNMMVLAFLACALVITLIVLAVT